MTRSIAVVSGYFSPLHVGHIRMMREARGLADLLVVVVNNDAQQVLKKGRVVIPARDRAEVVGAVGVVDEVVLAVDEDPSVRETLRLLRKRYPNDRIVFANGGDRSDAGLIAEADVCAESGIEIVFGVGGADKADSSSRIIAETGL
ncbi:glycerol-3-phosphate cytidylyltransferase/D-beta-D-heptose 7-phosphate kinase/D-beta-D-heptose 1-phosphate adenosyltransferase [Stackebrandtia albiflava]|uniref:Glycerol-3-phosphate cytidylyltransferase/D-beta-D-heptose 7-phosphate kinase/D-beta-D-heptose 1-phosphate adenosyltransferase n=1 Tax=Stackebrandtia albiflava TaxID=406432 RepID=A0A562VEH4_9ACTN|nr:adenylyltransferase/cytidyltransferase family protein [Stackebrandtia albiflava]TWJ16265.1 glycerol-3-phosphate cytidylyltransferase/D-beta-D-heptose 7-phosphate kinase/D-beta-D-heptose 1-phosphate adenosyltransferase [Stackebrandtia albiflava]